MKENISEIIIAIILVILAFVLLDPLGAFMPSGAQMMVLVLFLALFGAFIGLIWKEKVSDERENLHRLTAGRTGYLLGAAGLALGIVFQSFSYSVDPWLVIALVAMILGKVFSLVRSRNNS